MTDLTPVETAAVVPAVRRTSALSRRGLLVDAFLLALVAAGLYFRFSWPDWNQGTDLHPDEYGLTSTITQLSVPRSLDEYFNTRLSPLSPYQKYDENGQPTGSGPDNRMRWGQWPITLIRWAAEATGNTDYGKLRLMGRRLSALADSLALLFIYLIGRRLYGHRVGLLAAALSALAVMQIQQSHFMTADNFGVLFTAIAMYCAVRVAGAPIPGPSLVASDSGQESPPLRGGGGPGRGPAFWYALFGVAFGMALASRINLLPLAGEIVAAAFVAHLDEWLDTRRDLARSLISVGLRLALAGAVAFLTFRVTQPMSFRAETGDTTLFTLTPNPDWVDSMKVAQAESNGEGGGPPGEQWTNRPALIFPFVNMVLWGLGLPLGLAAWAGLAWAARRSYRGDEWRVHLLPLTWAGGYFLFMGTRWVKSIRYFLPVYPFLALFAAWAMLELWRKAQASRLKEHDRLEPRGLSRRLLAICLLALVTLGTLAWAWGFTGIYRRDNTRVQASRWIYQNIPAPLNIHIDTGSGSYTEPLSVPAGAQATADAAILTAFRAHVDGAVTGFTVGHARASGGDAPALLHVQLASDASAAHVLAEGDVPVAADSADDRGDSATIPLGPVPVVQGETYYILVTAPAGGPVSVTGARVSNESWDEGLPLRIDGRDAFGGLYSGVTMEVRWGDDENKRQMFLQNLAQVDYIFLPSQRAIWSAARLPLAYPMTMEYYRALFDGRLGFDLVAQFQSPITFGPLQISDVGGTAAWGRTPDLPLFNDNLLAAEEAFSVYDHAPVWIFKKRADFNLDQARAILEAVDLSTVVRQGPREATRTPSTLLMLPPDRLAAQRAGGTWSAMFNAEGPLNKYQPLGVLAWWLATLLMGWLAFPLTFVVFGSLPDKGYPLAKTVALLVAAWLAWMLGSFEILPFTQLTIALCIGMLAVVSAAVFWFRRAEITAYVRGHWRYLLTVELVFAALFVFDLLIRLGNPDLWHPSKGGEKPMDFSYFNAVLKSASFPPYDPWLAGGYLNYYYYGFVIVALPTKLLGIVPAFAYNLILPMLFALLGTGAFSVAFNLARGQKSVVRSRESEGTQTPTAMTASGLAESDLGLRASDSEPGTVDIDLPTSKPQPPTSSLRPSKPNPYLAGVAAALMIVVLGNLGQVHVITEGWKRSADHAALASSVFGDNDLTATLNGAWRVITGASPFSVGRDNWYWDATRIIPPGEGEAGPITEFPFFTFLYADLHAHMIDLPFTVLALAWAAAYLLGARRARPKWESAVTWLVGGLAFGVMRPTNTWDLPVYLALGGVAVLAAQWHRLGRLDRQFLWAVAWRLALLIGLAFILYQPYGQWYGSGYNSAKVWDGSKTPLDAYLYIHGLFLFILVTFLAWETRRWLAETPASVLAHANDWLPVVSFLVIALGLCVGVFLYLGIEIAAVTLPVMLWAGLLLLRSEARLPVEKRVILFLLGTGLVLTLVVEVVVLEGDISRMNTVFKFYLQVWTLFAIAAGAALAWVWAAVPEWKPAWQGGWTAAVMALAGCAALYTVSAATAKINDRMPQYSAYLGADPDPACQPIPGMPLPYADGVSLAPEDQPHSLNGLDYLQWSAYCDHTYFLPLVYDYEAIRWMQDNVTGSPVIAEAQSFDLYRLSSRYSWNTGLPDVVGWDWHQRQQRALVPTQFITERGAEVTDFYQDPDPASVADFVKQYAVRYIIVGPMERAYYTASGLAKFDTLAARGELSVAYQNPGVTIYEVSGP